MEQFKIMYKILRYLEKCMNYDEFDVSPITHEQLGISKNMWSNIVKMLFDNGYIENISTTLFVHSPVPSISNLDTVKITLKGLEYLEENTMMKKCADIARGIKETVQLI